MFCFVVYPETNSNEDSSVVSKILDLGLLMQTSNEFQFQELTPLLLIVKGF